MNTCRKLLLYESCLLYTSSYTQLSKKYNIPEGTISVWVHKYTTKAWDCSDRRGKKDDCDIDYKVRYEIVKKFLIFLQQKH